MEANIIKIDLTKFSQLDAKADTYYIDEENKLIARIIDDIDTTEDFINYCKSINIDIISVYDLFDINVGRFVIFNYVEEGCHENK